jgi:hypothetical protein
VVRPFSQLPDVLQKKGRSVSFNTTVLAKETAKAIGNTLVDTTRVDTGEARSNWLASLNVPRSDTIPPYAPGNKLGIGERANATRAKAQHASVIRQFSANKGNGIIAISNNVGHIGFLNDGSPTNTPDNMVERAVQVGRIALDAAIRRMVRR